MRVVSLEDIRDVYIKSAQRGLPFLMSKFSFSSSKRTKSSFNDTEIPASDWSQVPAVRKRWNKLITGDESSGYESYFSTQFSFPDYGVKMLSIGSGVCSHELMLAQLNPDWDITCVDFSENLLAEASRQAGNYGLKNMHFLPEDIYSYEIPEETYDIVFFHQSLHHFKPMDQFVARMWNVLKPHGKLVINEYVGPDRMQYGKGQLAAINEGLSRLEPSYKAIYKTKLQKNRYYGSGLLRMRLSDPSECVDSERILPEIHRRFTVVEEKGYGGNLLMPLLKDIAHHFLLEDEKTSAQLEMLFRLEDDYLRKNPSDFVFGVYEKE